MAAAITGTMRRESKARMRSHTAKTCHKTPVRKTRHKKISQRKRKTGKEKKVAARRYIRRGGYLDTVLA
eukprot:1197730-Rhodomonas_salina.1